MERIKARQAEGDDMVGNWSVRPAAAKEMPPPPPPVPASVCGEGDLEPHDASRLGEALAAAELQVDLALDLVVVSQSRHQLRQSERGDAQREVGSAHLVPRVRAVSAARAPGNLE